MPLLHVGAGAQCPCGISFCSKLVNQSLPFLWSQTSKSSRVSYSDDQERSWKHALEDLVVASHSHGLILHMPTRICKYNMQCTTRMQLPPMQISL